MINEQRIKLIFIIICFFQIFYIFHSRSSFNSDVFRDPFSKSSGVTHALEPNVIEIKKIIKKNNLKNFNLSNNLLNDTYLYQRSIEFNYPIRINKNSKYIFLSKEEEYLNSCEIVETGDFIKLIKC
jgi:hypothetical protein